MCPKTFPYRALCPKMYRVKKYAPSVSMYCKYMCLKTFPLP